MRNWVWLMLALISLNGCITRKTMVREVANGYMFGFIDGYKGCDDKIIEYNKFLFGDRVDPSKKKELHELKQLEGEKK